LKEVLQIHITSHVSDKTTSSKKWKEVLQVHIEAQCCSCFEIQIKNWPYYNTTTFLL